MFLLPGNRFRLDGRDAEIVAAEADRVTVRLASDELVSIANTDLLLNRDGRYQFDDDHNGTHDRFKLSKADQLQVPASWRAKFLRAEVDYIWAKTGQTAEFASAEHAAQLPKDVTGVDQRLAALVKLGHVNSRATAYRRYAQYWEGDWRGTIGKPKARTHKAHPSVDNRYLEEARGLARDLRNAGWSTGSQKNFQRQLRERIENITAATGEVIREPKQSTRYAVLKETLRASGILHAPIKTQEGKAASSRHEFGHIDATRAGQYVLIDTYRFDAHALSSFSAKWVPIEVTAAMDLYTHRILAYRVSPWTTGATDISLLLYEMFHPRREPWRFHTGRTMPTAGVPDFLLISSRTGQWTSGANDSDEAALPSIRPEMFVIDNGKVFASSHVRALCNAHGITILEGRLVKADDKAQIESFFNTIRVDLAEKLLGARGNQPTRHGRAAERNAVFTHEEIDALIRTYTLDYYHNTVHSGLHRFGFPNEHCTPNEKFHESVVRAGIRLSTHIAEDAVNLLPIEWVTVQAYGVKVDKLVYDGDVLKQYIGAKSRYSRHKRKWPIAWNPLDRQFAYFQDPENGRWHTLTWLGHASFQGPFSSSLMRHSVKQMQQTAHPRFNREGNENLVSDALNQWVNDVAVAADVPREVDAILMRMAGYKDVFRRFTGTITAFRETITINTHRNGPKHRAEIPERKRTAASGRTLQEPVQTPEPAPQVATTDLSRDDYYRDVV